MTLHPTDGSCRLSCANCPESLANSPLLLAAEQGHTTAQYLAAISYLNTVNGRPPNQKRAHYWLTQASKGRHMVAMARLGKALLFEELPEAASRDISFGLNLVMMAAKEGHRESALFFGALHLHGSTELAVAPNELIGVMFVELAARRGDVQAMEIMACYGLRKQEPRTKTLVWLLLLEQYSSDQALKDWCIASRHELQPSTDEEDIAVAELTMVQRRIQNYQQLEASACTDPVRFTTTSPFALPKELFNVGLPVPPTAYKALGAAVGM